MEYVFYIDVFFLTDLFLNFLALWLTAVFIRRKIHIFSVAVAAALGGIWNCLLLMNPVIPPTIELLITAFGVGSLMIRITFGTWDGILRNNTMLLAASSLLSGFVSFSREQFYLNGWESLFFAGAVAGVIGMFFQTMAKMQEIGSVRYQVQLYYRGRKRRFSALADSGNRLRVPETGKAVSLISYQDCQGFCEQISGGFFIPYRAVGTDHGLLFAITFEKMEIEKDGVCITIENPAVAITKESLSAEGDFNMLLPEEYVTEI